jgi:hypothetical protein
MDLLLKATIYSKCEWKICGGHKFVGSLLGMQSGYTKFCCFHCEGEGRAINKHYKIKGWPLRENSAPGDKCDKHKLLFDKDTPLHINLRLRESFVKVMNKSGKDFEYLKDNLRKLSDAKLRESIFIETKIRETLNDDLSEHLLKETEKSAWLRFKAV